MTHTFYLVSYLFVGRIGDRWELKVFPKTQEIGLPTCPIDRRPLPLRIHELLVQITGTNEVALVNFWPLGDRPVSLTLLD